LSYDPRQLQAEAEDQSSGIEEGAKYSDLNHNKKEAKACGKKEKAELS